MTRYRYYEIIIIMLFRYYDIIINYHYYYYQKVLMSTFRISYFTTFLHQERLERRQSFLG